MRSYYNQNYTRDQIDCVLDEIKNCIRNGRYIISQNENRKENIDFINRYYLDVNKQKYILLNIETDDFCHTVNNIKSGYEHEVLYVFVPQVVLAEVEEMKKVVDIYTKFNLIETTNGTRTVVISFHERNKPVEYLFRSHEQ